MFEPITFDRKALLSKFLGAIWKLCCGHLGIILSHVGIMIWVTWGHVGTTWAILGGPQVLTIRILTCWSHLGCMLGTFWCYVRPPWYDCMGHLGPWWCHLGDIAEPTTPDNEDLMVQTSWSRLEDMLGHVEAIGASIGGPLFLAIMILLSRPPGAILKLVCSNLGYLSPCWRMLAPHWVILGCPLLLTIRICLSRLPGAVLNISRCHVGHFWGGYSRQ
jgi:hypothetical protein